MGSWMHNMNGRRQVQDPPFFLSASDWSQQLSANLSAPESWARSHFLAVHCGAMRNGKCCPVARWHASASDRKYGMSFYTRKQWTTNVRMHLRYAGEVPQFIKKRTCRYRSKYFQGRDKPAVLRCNWTKEQAPVVVQWQPDPSRVFSTHLKFKRVYPPQSVQWGCRQQTNKKLSNEAYGNHSPRS